MIRFIILLYVLSISNTYASENIHFLNKPDSITATEAMIAISHAAKNRKYTVPSVIGDTLNIGIIHRGYNVNLNFSVSGNDITYTDSTTFVDVNDEDDTSETAKATPIPASWLKSLKSNSDNLFILIKNIKDNMNK